MPRVPFSPVNEERMQRLFPLQEWEQIRTALLDECGENIPGWQMAGLERLRCAVLKISDGELSKFYQAIDLAKVDVRDVLLWASPDDFADLIGWMPPPPSK